MARAEPTSRATRAWRVSQIQHTQQERSTHGVEESEANRERPKREARERSIMEWRRLPEEKAGG